MQSTMEILARIAAPANAAIPYPRVLAVFAHPDDEVLALGARLERLRLSRLLSVTDGAPANGLDARAHGFDDLDAYRRARRAELATALHLAGVPGHCAQLLAVPGRDGGERTIADQQASFHLTELARQIAVQISEFKPEAILTHPYEGGHPDHDSCAFAVHAAVQLLQEAPPIFEAPFYHAGSNGIETGCFLADSEAGISELIVCELTPAEQARKHQRLDCFITQRETLAQFGVEREQYRVAPAYDFTKPPHPGLLFYERFDWGVTGDRFRDLASVALAELGLGVASVGISVA